MDPTRFAPDAPGALLPIERGEVAFAPRPLPPDIALSAAQHALLTRAAELIGEIRGLTAPELVPSPSVLLRPLQREESLRSSSLEGTFATPEELLLFELQPSDPKAANDPANRWLEVHNHDLALQQGERAFEKAGVTLWTIRSLHQTLLQGVRGQDKSPGKFRIRQVFIGADHRFVPPPGHLVQPSMEKLVAYWNNPADTLPPIVRAFLFHYQFEAIHPFLDGNGRVGRLMLSLMLARSCGLGRPWLYLSSFFEEHRDEYMSGLMRVSTHADWSNWIDLCFRAVIAQGSVTIATLRELIALRRRWLEAVQVGKLKPRTLLLIDRLFERPAIDTITARCVMNGVSYNTARRDLDQLAAAGIVTAQPGSDPITYFAHDVMRIVHARRTD